MSKKFTAHEIAMSIKETNSLKAKCVKLEHDSRKLNALIASLRVLVKEMADALYEGARIGRDHPMYAGCVEFPEWGKSVSILVSKAREAVK